MFLFIVRRFGFLKHIPGLAIAFDSWLKIWSLMTNVAVLDNMDEIEAEVLKWDGIAKTIHKYGGLQFNYNGKELGHIHSNGLLDILLNRTIKQHLMIEGYINDHHYLKNTGWISYYMKVHVDAQYAVKLLKLAYNMQQERNITPPTP